MFFLVVYIHRFRNQSRNWSGTTQYYSVNPIATFLCLFPSSLYWVTYRSSYRFQRKDCSHQETKQWVQWIRSWNCTMATCGFSSLWTKRYGRENWIGFLFSNYDNSQREKRRHMFKQNTYPHTQRPPPQYGCNGEKYLSVEQVSVMNTAWATEI